MSCRSGMEEIGQAQLSTSRLSMLKCEFEFVVFQLTPFRAAVDVLVGLCLNADSAFPSQADASRPVISVQNGTTPGIESRFDRNVCGRMARTLPASNARTAYYNTSYGEASNPDLAFDVHLSRESAVLANTDQRLTAAFAC